MTEAQPEQQGRRLAALAVSGGAIGLATALLWLASANLSTVGVVLLIVVLFISTWGGLATGIFAAFVATACVNYFFIPPTGTLHVADADNWVALAAFLIAASLASRLVITARTQAARATARAAEVEALYELSIDLFSAESANGALGRAAVRAVSSTGAGEGGLALFGESGSLEAVGWIGAVPDGEVRQRMESIFVHLQTLEFSTSAGRDVYLPLVVGAVPVGVLVARGTNATSSALESVARLLTLAVEREKLLRDRAHMEALQESEALKTALVRAVSHDLSTPLTAMGLQVDGLRRTLASLPELTPRIDALAEELSRLRRRIGNLLSLARLETGSVVPRPEPMPVPDLFRSARESLPIIRAARQFHIELEDDCPDLMVDPSLALEIIVNLVENADRASPSNDAIELTGGRHPRDRSKVRLGILDRGSGVPGIADRHEEVDAGDVLPRGLGLEIATSFALACGGALRLSKRPGGGTCAWVDLPAVDAGAA